MKPVEINKLRQAVDEAGDLLKNLLDGSKPLLRHTEDFTIPADFASQRMIVGCLWQVAPDVPILVEEQDAAELRNLAALYPGILLITAGDDEEHLPPTYFSGDPLDGSALFVNGCPEISVSVALIRDGKPEAAIILMPVLGTGITAQTGEGCILNESMRLHLAEQRPLGECLIGLDSCRAVDAETDRRIILPLTKVFLYVRNLPSVASGFELLLGRTAAWVSTNARNWDVAGTALAVQEAGGVAECLDESPIPWNRVRMPPLLFAANRQIARSVRHIVGF